MAGGMSDTLLAKSTGETLATHTAWCLKAGRALLATLSLPVDEKRSLASDVLFGIALHDVGKAALGFQQVLRGERKDWAGKRHEALSAAFASRLPGASPAALLAILTHHRTIPDDGLGELRFGCLPPEQVPWDDDLTPVWLEMAEEWRSNLERFREEWPKICKAWGRADLLDLELGLAPLALDRPWLSRSTGRRGQRAAVEFTQRKRAALVRGLVIAADHLGSAHRVPPTIPVLKCFSVLKGEPREFQTVAAGTTGSAIIRAPTGSGKTEAALLWAQRNQSANGRLFYVLPYTASINAMYRRLGPGISADRPGVFGADNVGLLHSKATAALYTLLEGAKDDCSCLDRQENARALADLAHEIWFPIRVCTPHQIIRYILRGKGWESMLAEFPNACFIFDEVHAYDPRVVGLTLAAARLLAGWGARCLFLSATLPTFLEGLVRRVLGDLPVVVPDEGKDRDREILCRKRHMVSIRDGTLMDRIGEVVESVRSAESTLVVCNHVRTAQTVYEHMRSVFGAGARLLHGRFNQEDRNRIETEIVGQRLPKALVATQVVEVSLDVDFDQGFFEPAPIDALVQRMGRINRQGARAPAPVIIFAGQVNSYQLYCGCSGPQHDPACRVSRSIHELSRLANPIGEADLVNAADRVYETGYSGDEDRAFREGLEHPDIINFEQGLLAGAHQDWIEQVIESTDGTVEVLPACLKEEYESRKRKGLWIEANALLVGVRVQSLAWLRPKLITKDDPWILDCPYTPEQGLEL
jgi:CRISPR-associated endonuclease/helicase Cas3